MQSNSLIALLIASLAVGTPALAQDVSASASTSTSVSASASLPDVSASASTSISASASASTPIDESSSSASASGAAGASCDTLDTSSIVTGAVDPAALVAVSSVTVFALNDCTSVSDLAAIDAGASAELVSNPNVAAALQAQGYSGAEIVGYALDGSSLTVYVKK